MDEQQEAERYTCQDCFDEAMMDCGLLTFANTVPEGMERQFDEAYQREYQFAHIDPQGFRVPIRPRKVSNERRS